MHRIRDNSERTVSIMNLARRRISIAHDDMEHRNKPGGAPLFLSHSNTFESTIVAGDSKGDTYTMFNTAKPLLVDPVARRAEEQTLYPSNLVRLNTTTPFVTSSSSLAIHGLDPADTNNYSAQSSSSTLLDSILSLDTSSFQTQDSRSSLDMFVGRLDGCALCEPGE